MMKKILNFLISIFVLLSITMVIFTFFIDSDKNSSFSFETNWVISENEEFVFYQTTIDKLKEETYELSFLTNYQIISLSIDNKEVFSNNTQTIFHSMPTNQMARILIHNDSKSLLFSIKKNVFFRTYFIPDISLNLYDSALKSNLFHILFPIIFVFFFLIFGIIFIQSFLSKRNISSNKKSYLYLGFVSIFGGLFVLFENPYLNIYLGKYLFTSTIPYVLLMIVNILLLLFSKVFFKRENNFDKLFLLFYFMIDIILLMIHFSGFRNFFELNSYFLFLDIVAFLFLGKCFYQNMKRNKSKEDIFLFLGFLLFAILMIIRSMNFYFNFHFPSSILFYFGLLSFLLPFLIILIRNNSLDINVSLLNQYAFYDELTNVKNRTAYFNETKGLNGKGILGVFDVNFLKCANDLFGHLEGDKLLKCCVLCLQKSLQKYPYDLYRIGGDEFVCVLKTSSLTDQEIIDSIERTMNQMNKKRTIKISIAYGFVRYDLNKNSTNKMEDYFKIADNLMYENKKICHLKKDS